MLPQLILIAACAAADDRDPVILVKALASGDIAAREEAAGELEEVGRPALAALYVARDAVDQRSKRRVDQLIDLIERQRLLRATKLKLDFKNRPLAEVVAAIKERTGLPLRIDLQLPAAARERPITLEARESMPFWKAIDQLCAAGNLRYNPSAFFDRARKEPVVTLIEDDGAPLRGDRNPISVDDVGPFRLQVVRVHRHRQVKPSKPPAEPQTIDGLEVEIQVIAEPGLLASGNGRLVLQQAQDETGRDLRPKTIPMPTLRPAGPFGFDSGHMSILSYRVPLDTQEGLGRSLKRLKGYIPITVLARTSHPIVIPLRGQLGRPTSGGGLTVAVMEITREGQHATVRLTVQGERSSRAPILPAAVPLGDYDPPYRADHHVQLVDDEGRICRSYSIVLGTGQEDMLTVQNTVTDGQVGRPAELRYYGTVGAAAQLAFDFHDLPMP
jgi:hypothetical protein